MTAIKRCVLAAILTWLSPAAAQLAPSRLRVVVRTSTAADRELLARVRGQASDLDVELVEVSNGALEANIADQLHAAATLAIANDAKVVFWFSLDPATTGPTRSRMLVFVAEPQNARIFVRAVEEHGAPRPGEATAPSSFTLEAAALVVRTALQAFAAGGTIGIHWRTVDEKPPSAPATPPAPTAKSARSPGWFTSVGWQLAFDGYSPHGQSGLVADFGFALQRLEVAVTVTTSLPATLTADLSTVELSRHAVLAAAGWRFFSRRHLSLATRVGLGYAAFYRSTTTTAPSLEATASALTSSLLIGTELRASWRPLGGALVITSTVGLDILPGAPTLVYLIDGVPDSPRSLWVVQPRVSLAVGLIL